MISVSIIKEEASRKKLPQSAAGALFEKKLFRSFSFFRSGLSRKAEAAGGEAFFPRIKGAGNFTTADNDTDTQNILAQGLIKGILREKNFFGQNRNGV